ncbi:MAG: helix-turn-helix domain-containing protein [Candidatus Lindowbacteria bacterium]|nr:helix-turn-helix domain-containing protein [Candidatus Lindowbacteria bacterium]
MPQNLVLPQAADQQVEGVRLPDEGLSIEEVEKKLICDALARTGGHILKASRLLGMTYKTLQYRIKKYAIKV